MVNTKNQVFIIKPTDTLKRRIKHNPVPPASSLLKIFLFRYNIAWLPQSNFFPFRFSFSIVINKNMSMKGAGNVCFCVHIFDHIGEERIMNTYC